MSADAQQEMSREDKFFGISTPIGKKAGTADDSDDVLDVVIEDDRPPEDQKFKPASEKPVADDDDDDEGPSEEELAQYSAKVRKRINTLNYQKNEMRRRAEEAERMREEAVNLAHNLHQRVQQSETMISQGQAAMIARAKESAKRAVEMARASYRDAYEKGDTDKVIEAQEALIAAQAEQREADRAEREAQFRAQQPKPQQRTSQQQQPQQPQKPHLDPDSPEAKWAKKNEWFGKNKIMTATAFGVHEALITEEGINPSTPEYYKRIDSEMRRRFPDYFGETEKPNADEDTGSGRQPSSPRRAPPNVVESSSRSNQTRPAKTTRITSTQAALAKRLGITPEQYARELVKESQRNG